MNNVTPSNATQPSTNTGNILIILLDSLILVLSLCGNSLVIYTISKEHKLQTTCNYLLLNLAVCDIIVVSLGTSIDIMLQFTESKWILGSVLCRTLSPAMTMFYISGSLILVVISLDRYKMFVHPLRRRYQRKHVKYAVSVIHLISFTCVTPFAWFSTVTEGQCYDVWPSLNYRSGYTIFLFLMQYALPLLIMGIAYAGVALSLMRNKSTFKKDFNSRCREKCETTPLKSAMKAGSSSPSSHPSSLSMAGNYQPLSADKQQLKASTCKLLTFDRDEKQKFITCEQIDTMNGHSKIEEDGLNTSENTQSSTSKRGKPTQDEQDPAGSQTLKRDNNHNLTSTRPDHANPEHANTNDRTYSDRNKTSTVPGKQSFSMCPRSPPPHRRNAVRRRSPEVKRHHSSTSARDKRNNRALKMILLVVVVFALFMLPMQIMSLLLDFAGKPTPEKYRIYAWFVMCSYFGSCTLNPFIYGLVDRTFRAGFKKFAKKIACLCKCTLGQKQ